MATITTNHKSPGITMDPQRLRRPRSVGIAAAAPGHGYSTGDRIVGAMRVSIVMGVSPIAGWFLLGKIPIKKGWSLGYRKPPEMFQRSKMKVWNWNRESPVFGFVHGVVFRFHAYLVQCPVRGALTKQRQQSGHVPSRDDQNESMKHV